MRELVAKTDCELIELRGLRVSRQDLYDPHDYSSSRSFGVGLRWPESGGGESGIVYESVRRNDGTNVCVYRPSLIQLPVVQGDHYEYRWDAAGVIRIVKLSNIDVT
jgi:hypothetical protein